MTSATVVPETTENVSPPTGSACPVRTTVVAVLDTMNVACAQTVPPLERTATANRTLVHRCLGVIGVSSVAATPLSRAASRIGGRRLLLCRGAGLEGIARTPAGFSHPFPTDAGPSLPDLPSKRSDRCEHVEAYPHNGPGPIRGGFEPLHFRILEWRFPVFQKILPVFRPVKPRRAFPIARIQQMPIRCGPGSQLPAIRRRLRGLAPGPGNDRQCQGHAAHADEAFHQCFSFHNTAPKITREEPRGPSPA